MSETSTASQKETHQRETFEYRAEMKQLLHLLIHSLYTHPEVFLRELVSNASDALNKLRFVKLTNPEILDADQELAIWITTDKENGTLTIRDSGIGMSRSDLISKLGTVASSGTLEFLREVKNKEQSIDGSLIGQFGVGFYSSFMVADEVRVTTRHASGAENASVWVSSGEGSFSIEDSDQTERGTSIVLKLKADHKDFAEKYKLKTTVQKYSNFVDFPIYVDGEQINTVSALWHRKSDEIVAEDLKEFYTFVTSDYEEPLGHLHVAIEGAIEFKALLFIPSRAPVHLYQDTDHGLSLYVNRVLIQDDNKDLLPDYLRFVRGVVDTPDLPLNVSREVTQNSPITRKIRNVLTGRVLGLLEEWAKEDADKFTKFSRSFGPLLKLGINQEFEHRQRLLDLGRFETTLTKAGDLTSLADYVGRMKSDQQDIFFIAGENRINLDRSPLLEYYKKNSIEVLLLTDPTDVFVIPYVGEYNGKKLTSVDKVRDDTGTKEESTQEKPETSDSVLALFKSVLGDKVADVVESKRLVSSPVSLVSGSDGMDAHTERMMKMINKDFVPTKRVMEVNLSHPVLENIGRMHATGENAALVESVIVQLYEGAALLEGLLDSPYDFVSRMNDLIARATTK